MSSLYDNLVKLLLIYNESVDPCIEKAYLYAKKMHSGQYRQSGEEYITHPLMTACYLANMHADNNTIAAALLHDVLEDTPATEEEIKKLFGDEIYSLVNGVTNLNQINFSSSEEQHLANYRKILTSIINDVRIIVIKLADRLHNMQTLEYKSGAKQQQKALETLDIYAPMAFFLGAHRIKHELEDLSFMYLNPSEYRQLFELRKDYYEKWSPILRECFKKVEDELNDKNISFQYSFKVKNIYSLYKKLEDGKIPEDILDLLRYKIIVNDEDDCYRVLGIVHKHFKPFTDKFRDYIANPKTNMYRSLHTTVFTPYGKAIQVQIRTKEMEKQSAYGLIGYWTSLGYTKDEIQRDFLSKYQFVKSIEEINETSKDNHEFLSRVEKELFQSRIYVYDEYGNRYELSEKSSAIDYIYRTGVKDLSMVREVLINEHVVDPNTILKENDVIKIIYKKNKTRKRI